MVPLFLLHGRNRLFDNLEMIPTRPLFAYFCHTGCRGNLEVHTRRPKPCSEIAVIWGFQPKFTEDKTIGCCQAGGAPGRR